MSESDIIGLVAESTEVQDAGTDEPVYAEVSSGPWGIQWERERGPVDYVRLEAQPEHFEVRGPFIESRSDHRFIGDNFVVQESDDEWGDVIELVERLGGWDYIEM